MLDSATHTAGDADPFIGGGLGQSPAAGPARASNRNASVGAELAALVEALIGKTLPGLPTLCREGAGEQEGALRFAAASGEPLDQYIASRQAEPDVRREVSLVGQLACGLVQLHRHGLLHLRVRPSAVRIDVQARTASLVDWGDASPRGATAMPMCPSYGDLPYSSAEMLARERPDQSDDVYSLACVAYELLTGLHPYARRSAIDAAEGTVQPAVIVGLTDRQNAVLLGALEPRRAARTVAMADLALAFGGHRLDPRDRIVRAVARVVLPHARLGLAMVAAFALGMSTHSAWIGWTVSGQQTSARMAATIDAFAGIVTSPPAMLEHVGVSTHHYARGPAEASTGANTKRVVAPSEASSEPVAERRAQTDRSINEERKRTDSATSRSTQQAQASAVFACPTCSCEDLSAKRFLAGQSLNWEEANFYMNVCGDRG